MVISIFDDNKKGNPGVKVSGDLYFRLINSKNGELICRFAMNTSFVSQKSNIYTFDKKGVDPDSIIKNKKFDNDFKIDLHFEDVCKSCKPTNPL
jgi:hypothetical protein